jgi:hypothetical protein
MNGGRAFVLLFSLILFGPAVAVAQATQTVEDAEVGVRFVIPKGWEWRKRESTQYQRASFFVNCMPEVTKTYPCNVVVDYFAAPAGQSAFTDADRRKWESAYSASGMRKIESTRDLTVGGFPAFEIVGREGLERDAARSSSTFILVPAAGRLFRFSYMANHDGKEYYDRFRPEIDAALKSFALVGKSAVSPKGK